MSKHDQFIHTTHFLLAINRGWGVNNKHGLCLDVLFTLYLLFIVLEPGFLLRVSLILCLNFMVHIQNTFYYFSGSSLQADKDGDQVQHNSEHHGNHLHVEEGKDEQ